VFAQRITAEGYMVITGAGSGIMRAAQEGAGAERSFGVNIRLPFEQEPNEFISKDPKLTTFRYFFTRKLIFIKEADAAALFPGGFGTLDEGYECLTLVQTGKTKPCRSGSSTAARDVLEDVEALRRGPSAASDLAGRHGALRVTASVEEAVAGSRTSIIYHSSRTWTEPRARLNSSSTEGRCEHRPRVPRHPGRRRPQQMRAGGGGGRARARPPAPPRPALRPHALRPPAAAHRPRESRRLTRTWRG
jgi:hypothetical protein